PPKSKKTVRKKKDQEAAQKQHLFPRSHTIAHICQLSSYRKQKTSPSLKENVKPKNPKSGGQQPGDASPKKWEPTARRRFFPKCRSRRPGGAHPGPMP